MVQLLIVLLISCVGAAASAETPKICPWTVGSNKINSFPVLPGSGWDNLRNREMGPVADVSLSGDCQLTVDGLYAIPDQVIAYPLKESRVSLMSNIIEHYESYVSSTSRSVNAGGGGSFFGGLFGIDGKFSQEFQEVKRTALYSSTQIGRTKQRYDIYVARMLPDFRLSQVFKACLMSIGGAVAQNLTAQARYLSDLLVRDFGTHVITSIDAGALLEKLDYFNYNSLTKSGYTRNKISQCMSVDFFSIYSAGESSSLVVTNEELKGYRTSVQKTTVNAHGGPPVEAKINLTEWKNGLKRNLVAIDRVGDLLYTVVNHRTLPELPGTISKGVSDAVKDAVTRYYLVNRIQGCQNPESPNFEPLANVEGLCEAPLTNFSFGGVYQTCSQEGWFFRGLCGEPHSPMQANYFTGGYSCPDGYEPTLLLRFVGFDYHFWFWNTKTVLETYWCAARKSRSLPSQSGALFGGAYSPRVNNPMAGGAKACPPSYLPYRIGWDISLCISSDMTEEARSARLPLGGFFSCGFGNPLAEPGRRIVASSANFKAPPPPPPPKRCPDGFTQSAIDMLNGCGIMQCTRHLGGGGKWRDRLATSRRPPFESDPETNAWSESEPGYTELGTAAKNAMKAPVSSLVMSVIAVCVAVGVALALAFAAIFSLFSARRRQRRRRGLWTEVSGTHLEADEVSAANGNATAAEAADSMEEDARRPLLG